MSRANRCVAGILEEAAFGTLLFDLLTPDEEQLDRRGQELPFDVELLSSRLSRTVESMLAGPPTRGLRIGLFGIGTGTAAALTVAAQRPADIAAVVSRSGRPDLASEDLRLVTAPTLLIVGVNDAVGLAQNRFAAAELADATVQIVAGGSHALDEPGALRTVAELALAWFVRMPDDSSSREKRRSARRPGQRRSGA